MNAAEMLDNVHLRTIKALDDLPELQWDIPTNSRGETTVKRNTAVVQCRPLAK